MVWEVLIAVGKVGDQLGKFLLINQWWGVMMAAAAVKDYRSGPRVAYHPELILPTELALALEW